MEKKKHTKWHSSARSCFYVVKRSNISAHSAFISAEPATTQKEREREREFTLLTFPALSPSVCGALLLLLKRGLRKVHHGNRGIWWQEAFCEVAGADITHPIMQSSQQLPLGNKTRNFFTGFLLEVKRHPAIHAAESVSWTLRLYLIIRNTSRHRKGNKHNLDAVTGCIIFSRCREMSFYSRCGSGSSVRTPGGAATAPPWQRWLVKVGSVK